MKKYKKKTNKKEPRSYGPLKERAQSREFSSLDQHI